MSYRAPVPNNAANEWPAVTVAIGILVLLGAVLVTATARWTASDVRDLVGTLAPVIGVITGAFVTYFFTRQAQAAATNAAQTATTVATQEVASTRAELESRGEQLTDQAQRSRALHNALTTVVCMAPEPLAERMRNDPAVSAVLNSHRS